MMLVECKLENGTKGALKYNTEIQVMWKVDCGSRNIACLDDILLSSIAEQDLVITSISWNAESHQLRSFSYKYFMLHKIHFKPTCPKK
jgi:hypothetical protein